MTTVVLARNSLLYRHLGGGGEQYPTGRPNDRSQVARAVPRNWITGSGPQKPLAAAGIDNGRLR